MKAILVFVSTLDGKVTQWGNPDVRSWSSQSDKEYFGNIWNKSRLIIMGSTTYNVEQLKPSPKHLYIVMTHKPSEYRVYEKTGQLEFTDEPPEALFSRLEKEGHELMVVVGGSKIATSFLKKQLIDELWLTIEPRIFGTGGSFVTGENLDINLQLLSSEKVNEQGTIIGKYRIIKS